MIIVFIVFFISFLNITSCVSVNELSFFAEFAEEDIHNCEQSSNDGNVSNNNAELQDSESDDEEFENPASMILEEIVAGRKWQHLLKIISQLTTFPVHVR